MKCLLVALLVLVVEGRARGEGVLGRRVAVASCRAGCLPLQEVSGCWADCQQGASNRVGGRGRGGRRVKAHLSFSSPPAMLGCSLAWGELGAAPNSFSPSSLPSSLALVYMVVGRSRAGEWREAGQTSSLSLALQPQQVASLSSLTLLAVGERGVLAREVIHLGHAGCRQEGTHQQEEQEEQEAGPVLSVVAISSLPSSPLVSVSLTWPSSAASQYLVQWASPDSPVSATLQTSLHTASLSLLPGLYRARLQGLGQQGEVVFTSPHILIEASRGRGRSSTVLLIVLAAFLLVALGLGVIGYKLRPAAGAADDEEESHGAGGAGGAEEGAGGRSPASRRCGARAFYRTVKTVVALLQGRAGKEQGVEAGWQGGRGEQGVGDIQ